MPRPLRLFLTSLGLLAILGLIAGAVALTLLPSWLQTEDPPERADYIVVLDGDPLRYFVAAELFKAGYAPKVLLSNGRLLPPNRWDRLLVELGWPDIAPNEVRARALAHLGVPREATAAFGDRLISTLEEAEALRAYLGDRDSLVGACPDRRTGTHPGSSPGQAFAGTCAARLILVTSPYHTRRVRIIFGDVMPATRFVVVATPEGRIASRWWGDQFSAIATVLETAKIVNYRLGGVFRAGRREGAELPPAVLPAR